MGLDRLGIGGHAAQLAAQAFNVAIDIALVAGIRRHTDAPRQPRPVPPLRGDYRQ